MSYRELYKAHCIEPWGGGKVHNGYQECSHGNYLSEGCAACEKLDEVQRRDEERVKTLEMENAELRVANSKLRREVRDFPGLLRAREVECAAMRSGLEAVLIKVDWNSDEFHDSKQYEDTRRIILEVLATRAAFRLQERIQKLEKVAELARNPCGDSAALADILAELDKEQK